MRQRHWWRWSIFLGLALVAASGLPAGIRRLVSSHGAAAAPTAPPLAAPAPVDAPRTAPLALPSHPRVLVFAPHPDDETLAAGGLITRLVRERAPLRVVFLTDGDGYPRAAESEFDVTRPTEADYVALGELRKREALAALARLGVPRRQVRFLGFPDGGLAELWRTHWLPTHPYTSPYTKEASPPEPEGIYYDGQDLTSVIARVVREFRPSVVVMPHPYDVHLDHAHTSYFVTEALARLEAARGLPARPTVLTYLVHYPAWPATLGPGFDRVRPLPGLPDTAWVETELAPAEFQAKQAALAEYRSQLEVMNGFLRSFVCRNEVFATVDGQVLDRIASIH